MQSASIDTITSGGAGGDVVQRVADRVALAAPLGVGADEHFGPVSGRDLRGAVVAVVCDDEELVVVGQVGSDRFKGRGQACLLVVRGHEHGDRGASPVAVLTTSQWQAGQQTLRAEDGQWRRDQHSSDQAGGGEERHRRAVSRRSVEYCRVLPGRGSD